LAAEGFTFLVFHCHSCHIRLTDFETLRDWTCFDADTGKDLAVEVREYFIPDFSNWKDHDAFESAFARLKKDLEDENSRRS